MIYLDAAATTQTLPEVLDTVWPLMTTEFGNPSSRHTVGETAARALDYARATAASVLGVREGDIVFTSGGTESNNLALKGLALGRPRGRHLVVSAVEHSSVREAAGYLKRHHGFAVDVLPVDRFGRIDVDELAGTVRADTTLVSIMAVNNEVGTIQPVAEAAGVAHGAGALFHTDAVQAAGWLDLGPLAAASDALSVSGHKLGGLKGAGLLMVRGRHELEPVAHGGGQERGRRSGTENVAGAVATATALRIAARAVERGGPEEGYGGYLVRSVVHWLAGDGAVQPTPTGDPARRVPGIVSFCFPGTSGEAVLLELERRGVVCSSGSACHAGSTDPSHVLLAMGYDADTALTAVRLSFTRRVKEAEITTAARSLVAAVRAVAGSAARP